MKKFAILCLVGLLSACQAGTGMPAPAPASSAPVPGGSVDQNPDDAAMQAIFREAEKLLQAKYPSSGLRLTSLKKISSQVVAGANYRIEADYSDSKKSGLVRLLVFRSLQGQYSLSSDDYTP